MFFWHSIGSTEDKLDGSQAAIHTSYFLFYSLYFLFLFASIIMFFLFQKEMLKNKPTLIELEKHNLGLYFY